MILHVLLGFHRDFVGVGFINRGFIEKNMGFWDLAAIWFRWDLEPNKKYRCVWKWPISPHLKNCNWGIRDMEFQNHGIKRWGTLFHDKPMFCQQKRRCCSYSMLEMLLARNLKDRWMSTPDHGGPQDREDTEESTKIESYFFLRKQIRCKGLWHWMHTMLRLLHAESWRIMVPKSQAEAYSNLKTESKL